MSDQFKKGQLVECSEVPGQKFEIVDVIGEGDCTQYMLAGGTGERSGREHYGYVLADSLKLC